MVTLGNGFGYFSVIFETAESEGKGKTMKKIAIIAAAFVLAMCMLGCSSQSAQSASQESEPAKPLDLTGNWKQSNSDSSKSWQEAEIADGEITVWWVTSDSKMLYWAGTYTAPTEAVDSYSWQSENDKEQTSKAIMASSVETKEFSYSSGVLSYEASAMGVTKTVELQKFE